MYRSATSLPNEPVTNGISQKAHCQTCSLRSLCLPRALEPKDMDRFDMIVRRPVSLKKGEALFRQGSSFTAIYAVRAGSLKQVTSDGDDGQLTHLYMPSELAGLDGIVEDVYPGSVFALETTSVCEIPFDQLNTLSEYLPSLRAQLYKSMSKEMRGDLQMIRLLSNKTAEQCFASTCLIGSGGEDAPPTDYGSS